MADNLQALLRAIEKAKAPHRDLDAAIWEQVGLTEEKERHCRDWCGQDGRTDLSRADYINAWAPDYTREIDAAMSLLAPRGYPLWTVTIKGVAHGASHSMSWSVEVTVPSREAQGLSWCNPALAICAAALRAREFSNA